MGDGGLRIGDWGLGIGDWWVCGGFIVTIFRDLTNLSARSNLFLYLYLYPLSNLMSITGIDMFRQTRQLLALGVQGLTAEQMLAIPAGFDNNIAWNLGHILTVQQSLIYRLSGLPTYTTAEQNRLYRPGTSPADWPAPPDLEELIALIPLQVTQLAQDYAEGKFTTYQEYTTSLGVRLQRVEDAIGFNTFHEGLHLGTILALRNFV